MTTMTRYYITVKKYYCPVCGAEIPEQHKIFEDSTVSIAKYRYLDWECVCSEIIKIKLEYISQSTYIPPPAPPSPPGLLGDWYYDSDEGDTTGTVFDHSTHTDNIGDGTITDYDGGGA